MAERSNPRQRALIVDDDSLMSEGLEAMLTCAEFAAHSAATATAAREANRKLRPDVALVDLRLADESGLDLLAELRESDHRPAVILISGYATVQDAVQAMRAGADDVLEKPIRRDALLHTIGRALERRALQREVEHLRAEVRAQHQHSLIGRSPKLAQVLRTVERVARTANTTVLIQGESGTGKELVARHVHELSDRCRAPFVAVNCAALNEPLLEAELFGYVRGAFTGADPKGRAGLLSAASGGTLFLDEIGELAPALQAKLLRFLQERTFRRVGATDDEEVDVRILAATNRDLLGEVEAGRFREDLYYRLGVVILELPPLRERPDDVPLLAHAFLERFERTMGHGLRGFDEAALAALQTYAWPGNIRELRNKIEHAIIVSEGPVILRTDLGLDASRRSTRPHHDGRALPLTSFEIKEMERLLIEQVIRETDANISKSSRLLGINRSTLYAKLKAYEIDPEGLVARSNR
ncbi:MAG: sigma-54-dependent Fis family transcriptional regulator [Planctomycetes bacterium]|nr:sigma-54-dependent Fis family transcriptional regulator [Planctomycetota bacterium]